MTYRELKNYLTDTGLFTPAEVYKIVRACESYTLGNAIYACDLAGIVLRGSDIDIIIQGHKIFLENKS